MSKITLTDDTARLVAEYRALRIAESTPDLAEWHRGRSTSSMVREMVRLAHSQHVRVRAILDEPDQVTAR